MTFTRRLIFAFLLLAGAGHALADLPPARDLRQEAEAAARKGAVLIVLYSRTDCPYCRTVRQNYLEPLIKAGDRRVSIVELVADSDAPIRDFQGRPTSSAAFAAAAGVKLAPVVAFYGRLGEKTAKPLIGALLADFYPAYLEAAISESLAGRAR